MRRRARVVAAGHVWAAARSRVKNPRDVWTDFWRETRVTRRGSRVARRRPRVVAPARDVSRARNA